MPTQWSIQGDCEVSSASGFDVLVDHMLITLPDTSQINYICDDGFIPVGFSDLNVASGMTVEEFDELWPLVLGIMILGFLIKSLRRVFE